MQPHGSTSSRLSPPSPPSPPAMREQLSPGPAAPAPWPVPAALPPALLPSGSPPPLSYSPLLCCSALPPWCFLSCVAFHTGCLRALIATLSQPHPHLSAHKLHRSSPSQTSLLSPHAFPYSTPPPGWPHVISNVTHCWMNSVTRQVFLFPHPASHPSQTLDSVCDSSLCPGLIPTWPLPAWVRVTEALCPVPWLASSCCRSELQKPSSAPALLC